MRVLKLSILSAAFAIGLIAMLVLIAWQSGVGVKAALTQKKSLAGVAAETLKFEAAPGGGYVARWSDAGSAQPEEALARCWETSLTYNCLWIRVTDMSSQNLPKEVSANLILLFPHLPKSAMEITNYLYEKSIKDQSGYSCIMDVDGAENGITEEISSRRGTIAINYAYYRGLFQSSPWRRAEVISTMQNNKISFGKSYFSCPFLYQRISQNGLESMAADGVSFEQILGLR